MRKQLFWIFPVILLFLSACSKETELKKSVFIPDNDYPDLPQYSEWGYNTFGAYYDREIFVSNDNKVPAKVINSGGKTSFTLKGQLGAYNYYNYSGYPVMLLTFDLKGFSPQSFSDLIALNDTIIDLKNSQTIVSVMIDTAKYEGEILNGTLNFKRAQNLIVDKQQAEIILSGTFEFQAILKNEPVSVTLGRFDVGIGPDNFFRY